MRSNRSSVILVTAIIGLVLVMLPVPTVGSSSSTDDYSTVVFGVA